jgi:hypothetical protein
MSPNGGRSTLHRARIFQGRGLKTKICILHVAELVQGLGGQEEVRDQLRGGTLQPWRVRYSDLVSYQCKARNICSLIPVPLIYHLLGSWKMGLNFPFLRLDMASTEHCAIVLPAQTTVHGGVGRSREVHESGQRQAKGR